MSSRRGLVTTKGFRTEETGEVILLVPLTFSLQSHPLYPCPCSLPCLLSLSSFPLLHLVSPVRDRTVRSPESCRLSTRSHTSTPYPGLLLSLKPKRYSRVRAIDHTDHPGGGTGSPSDTTAHVRTPSHGRLGVGPGGRRRDGGSVDGGGGSLFLLQRGCQTLSWVRYQQDL